MSTPTRADIESAATRIEGWIRRTPVLALPAGTGGVDARITLKLDLLQPTGSFKVRGAFSRLLAIDPRPTRVVAASGGNFGLAVAYAARHLGIGADIFVPKSSPQAKISRLHDEGAAVHLTDGFFPAAFAAAQEFAARHDAPIAHAYDQFDVVAGQGTCGREMEQQVPDADSVLVAVGGGGLIGGIASWYRGATRVIGAETPGTSALHAARAAGSPVDVEVGGVASDALGAARLGEIAWEANQWIADSVLVTDEAVRGAQRWLWDNCRLIAEPGAVTPIAALTSGAYRPEPDEHVLVLVCGANTDPGSIMRS